MKFVAIVAGAGALVFMSALIMIVASVYSRSQASPRALASTNLSVTPGPAGSVAHAGSLGALYGADAQELGGPSDVTNEGRDTPFLSSPQRFTFSRLICSPVPVGECAMKRRKREKEEHDYEDWSSLSTTAEELRRTVALQNEQIEVDRKTIDELTGKLAECESALLDDRSVSERGAEPGPAPRRRLMAEDAQLNTARAVEELERAILQLKDRIEKLEVNSII